MTDTDRQGRTETDGHRQTRTDTDRHRQTRTDRDGHRTAPAPESNKQGAKKSFRGWGHGEGRTQDADDAEGCNGKAVSPPCPIRGLGERCHIPQRGPGQSPGEKRFYCFLNVSARLSLQRLLKILTSFTADRWLRKMCLLNVYVLIH